jgi:hypothetical protein
VSAPPPASTHELQRGRHRQQFNPGRTTDGEHEVEHDKVYNDAPAFLPEHTQLIREFFALSKFRL